jgi:cytochrome c5
MRISRTAIVLAAALPIAGVAQPAERTGEQIVKQQCAGCHEKGVNGAPRIDDRAAWVPRMKQGLDAMVRSAINGHGKMPARGGLVNVTDTELRSAITYMFNPAGIPPKPSPPPALGPNQKVVDGTEIYLGVAPKGGDVHIVTITLRDAQTHKPIEGARVGHEPGHGSPDEEAGIHEIGGSCKLRRRVSHLGERAPRDQRGDPPSARTHDRDEVRLQELNIHS